MIKFIIWKLFKGIRHPYSSRPVLLVSGIGRSGTTVLRKSLERHPAIDSTCTENNAVYDLLEAGFTSVSKRAQAIKTSKAEHNELFYQTILNISFPRPKLNNDTLPSLFCDLQSNSIQYFL